MDRILVMRLSSMGDVIHTLPAVALLRRVLPNSTIGWAIEERWIELLCARPEERLGPRSPQKPLVDRVHILNTKAWRSAPFSDQTWREIRDTWDELKSAGYDAAFDWQGAVRTAMVPQMLGTPLRVGFVRPREGAAGVFYNRTVEAMGTHIIEQNISLVADSADHTSLCGVQFPCDPTMEAWADRELEKLGGNFAIVNPGAGWGAKCWPAERYGDVARRLGETGLKSVINFGPGEEELARTVAQAGGSAASAISCSVGQLIALTRRAKLFIGGDTGPMHLAAALKVPVVAIFGPTNPTRNGPFGTRSRVLRSPESPTTHARRKRPDEGMLNIHAEEVAKAAVELLAGG